MASGHENRASRSNTWLHRPAANVKKTLANGAPSTHGHIDRQSTDRDRHECSGGLGLEAGKRFVQLPYELERILRGPFDPRAIVRALTAERPAKPFHVIDASTIQAEVSELKGHHHEIE